MTDLLDTHDGASDDGSDTGAGGLFAEPEGYYPPTPPPTFVTHNLLPPSSLAITVRLVGKSPLWGHLLWNASRICANYIQTHADDLVRNRTILEFGAGAGLPSLLCAALGAAAVVVTDYPDPDLLENLEYNRTHAITKDASSDVNDKPAAEASSGAEESVDVSTIASRIACAGYRWGADAEPLLAMLPPEKKSMGGYDTLILSDLIFNHTQHEALLQSIRLTLAKPHGVALVFFTPHRPWLYDADMNFFTLVRDTGDMEVTQVLEHKMEKAMFDVDRGDENVRRMVYGYRITWKDGAASE
ncbi:nicotinamide n-methyltransferase [Orbilia brochopaga]|uniref:Protein N-terminal and lysine N-methyltransferase EFM7 n=1 Tax=Orbilia brochopaga TaxID=3140254 RepID=A0AAV9TWM8_9PEZI